MQSQEIWGHVRHFQLPIPLIIIRIILVKEFIYGGFNALVLKIKQHMILVQNKTQLKLGEFLLLGAPFYFFICGSIVLKIGQCTWI